MFIGNIFQIVTLLNFFFNIYILFVLAFFGYLEIVGEGFLVVSLINILTHGLSGNIRNIYLGSKDQIKLRHRVHFRSAISIIAYIIVILVISAIFGNSNILFHSSIIFLTITSWVLDLLIARLEKNSSFNIYLFLNQLFLFSLFPICLFVNNILLGNLLIYFYCLINFIIFRKYFKNFFKINLFIKENLFNSGTFSTLLKTVSNFAWRYFAIILVGKAQSSILFLGFALGSFFSTIFDISFGAYWFKRIVNKNLFINILYLIYFLAGTLVVLIFSKFAYYDDFNSVLFNYTFFFSVCGSYILVFTLKKRQSLYEIKKYRETCYKLDIISYTFNFMVIPLVYFINKEYLSASYLFSSLFSYVIFFKIYNDSISKK